MQDWNVVITVNEQGFREAFAVLDEFGPVRKTDFFNVLVMRVNDVPGMLEILNKRLSQDPLVLSFLSRLIPVSATFSFQSPEEFESKAKEAILAWAPELAGKGFHVRMHRRGFRGKLSSLEAEHLLDKVLLESLERAGTPGHITFKDPDAVIAVETIAQRGGLSFWSRENLSRYPFMRID